MDSTTSPSAVAVSPRRASRRQLRGGGKKRRRGSRQGSAVGRPGPWQSPGTGLSIVGLAMSGCNNELYVGGFSRPRQHRRHGTGRASRQPFGGGVPGYVNALNVIEHDVSAPNRIAAGAFTTAGRAPPIASHLGTDRLLEQSALLVFIRGLLHRPDGRPARAARLGEVPRLEARARFTAGSAATLAAGRTEPERGRIRDDRDVLGSSAPQPPIGAGRSRLCDRSPAAALEARARNGGQVTSSRRPVWTS